MVLCDVPEKQNGRLEIRVTGGSKFIFYILMEIYQREDAAGDHEIAIKNRIGRISLRLIPEMDASKKNNF